jgi:hypothetical protein
LQTDASVSLSRKSNSRLSLPDETDLLRFQHSFVYSPPPAGKGHDNANQVPDFADRRMVEFVFSTAHLMDNRKGYYTEPQKTLERLRFISRLTGNLQITNDINYDQASFVKVYPEQLFLPSEAELTEILGPDQKSFDLTLLIEEMPSYHQLKTRLLSCPHNAFGRYLRQPPTIHVFT